MKLNIKLKYGSTRTVLLIGGLAIKFPSMVEWRLFLYGLLGNMSEHKWWKSVPLEYKYMLCPVLFYVPGGFCVVMRRANEVNIDEFFEIDVSAYDDAGLCFEDKPESFGKINNNYVIIDYGS